jgi:hypothetical protein
MPLPTAAELTDPNATNTQMKQRLGQLAENVADKVFVEEKTQEALNAVNDVDEKYHNQFGESAHGAKSQNTLYHDKP